MLHIAHAARSNHRNVYRFADGSGQRQIETNFGAVSVHAGEQNFTRATRLHVARPLYCVQACFLATTVGKHFPTAVVGIDCFGIYRHHNGLRTKKAAGLVDQIRIGHRRRVDAGLVCASIEQTAHIGHRTHTTAHRQGNEHLAGHAFNHMQYGVAVV